MPTPFLWSGLLGFTLTEQAKLGLVIQASKDLFFTKEDLCDKMLILLIEVGQEVCISNMFSDEADDAGPGITLWEPLH